NRWDGWEARSARPHTDAHSLHPDVSPRSARPRSSNRKKKWRGAEFGRAVRRPGSARWCYATISLRQTPRGTTPNKTSWRALDYFSKVWEIQRIAPRGLWRSLSATLPFRPGTSSSGARTTIWAWPAPGGDRRQGRDGCPHGTLMPAAFAISPAT